MSDSRLFKILYYLLDKGRATAPELAAQFEVSQRTIYRDIDALSSAGIPVYTEPGRNGGICLLHDFILDRAILSESERQDVLTAVQSVSATGFASGKEMLTKLSGLFRTDTENWLEVDFSRWHKSTSDNAKFELFKTAVIQHQEVKIIYVNTNGEKSERIIQPLKLAYKSKEWYLKSFCLTKQDFRIFKLNRILKAQLLSQTFTPRPYPQQAPNPQSPSSEVVLLFPEEIAYRFYDEFDGTQIQQQKDGSFLVTAQMFVDAWLIGYLLSFGTQIEIIRPKYLRDILAEQARKIYEKYKC
jgi:Predicted transcriptional regulator